MSFISELKRRKIPQVAAVYAVVAWLLVQIVATVEAPLSLPDWFDTMVIVLLLIGFPITLIMSWAYNVTPEGLQRDEETDHTEGVGSRRIEYVLIGLLVVAVAWLVYRDISSPEIRVAVSEPNPAETIVEEEARAVLPNSVAVLPFENLSPDPDNAYFAAGIHEDILNQLAKISDLSVISRTSVLRYGDVRPPIPEIAETLNVQAVLEGSVRFADGQVRVQAQLIDGVTDEHLWADVFQRDLADVFAIQTEIAEQIAAALQAELSSAELARIETPLTNSPEALRFYTQSLPLRLPTALELEYLDRAIDLDPDFARAYASRAHVYAGASQRASSAEDRSENQQRAIDDAGEALQLDPQLGYAHAALARLHEMNFREDEARDAYENAIRLSPNDTKVLDNYAAFSAVTGDYSKGIRLTERAVKLDPVNADLFDALGDKYFIANNLQAAAEAYNESIRLDPGHPGAERRLGMIEAIRGNVDAAVEHLRRIEDFGNSSNSQIAYTYARLGLVEDAARILENREVNYDDPSNFMDQIFASLAEGDEEGALRAMNRYANLEYVASWTHYSSQQLKINIFRDPVLDQPEFQEARKQLGFARQ